MIIDSTSNKGVLPPRRITQCLTVFHYRSVPVKVLASLVKNSVMNVLLALLPSHKVYPYSFDTEAIIKTRHYNFTIQIHIQFSYDKMPRKAHIS